MGERTFALKWNKSRSQRTNPWTILTLRDQSFGTYAKFSKKLTFLIPDTHLKDWELLESISMIFKKLDVTKKVPLGYPWWYPLLFASTEYKNNASYYYPLVWMTEKHFRIAICCEHRKIFKVCLTIFQNHAWKG